MDIAQYIRNKNNENKLQGTYSSHQDAFNKYSNMNEEQLMQELFRVGSLSSGKVSEKDLDDFYRKASPYLSPEQSARMRDLITALKNS